ncbi:hypothetical protein FOA52_007069 [Chlamydomonas sp. UWO 241]|nr:hypothetical protein FOA52_007069 [Chlamydomonas sp. UWO 241]
MGARVEAAGYDYSTVAENVAWGQDSVDAVMASWLESPGHRENILNADVVSMGGGRAGPYWALVLAS